MFWNFWYMSWVHNFNFHQLFYRFFFMLHTASLWLIQYGRRENCPNSTPLLPLPPLCPKEIFSLPTASPNPNRQNNTEKELSTAAAKATAAVFGGKRREKSLSFPQMGRKRIRREERQKEDLGCCCRRFYRLYGSSFFLGFVVGGTEEGNSNVWGVGRRSFEGSRQTQTLFVRCFAHAIEEEKERGKKVPLSKMQCLRIRLSVHSSRETSRKYTSTGEKILTIPRMNVFFARHRSYFFDILLLFAMHRDSERKTAIVSVLSFVLWFRKIALFARTDWHIFRLWQRSLQADWQNDLIRFSEGY